MDVNDNHSFAPSGGKRLRLKARIGLALFVGRAILIAGIFMRAGTTESQERQRRDRSP